MRRPVLLAVAVAALLAPAPAGASTLVNQNGVLTFTADPGEVNVVEFRNGPNVTVTLAAGDADPIDNGPPNCIVGTPQREYTCQNVARIVVDVSGGNDSVDGAALTGVPLVASGGDGADEIVGGPHDDTLDGGPGADSLDGEAGRDMVSGGAGDDSMTGDLDNDLVDGGEGDDSLGGGGGADTLVGGPGIDHANYDARPAVDVSLDGAPNDGQPGEGDNVMTDVEDVTAAAVSGAPARLTGSAAGNVLTVDGGLGTLVGGAGSDTLVGGPQDDTIDARDGYADRVYCAGGTDTALVDPLDTVSQSCENAPVTVVAGGADDRPPTVTWAAPSNGASFRGNTPTTLSASAADDRGVAKVQFFDDDRLVCEDAVAPYTCSYRARGADVGRNTLIATAIDGADQAGSAVRLVNVGRFRPTSLTLAVSPRRDRRAPYTFFARGALAGAGSCSGTVRITAKAGRRTVFSRRARVARTCDYALMARFRSRPARSLRFTARYGGNRTTLARTSRRRTARLG